MSVDHTGDRENPHGDDAMTQGAGLDPAADDTLLDFDDDDGALPWLESDDDLADEGPDTARIVGFALFGLLALAAIIGGIWWASNRAGSSDVEPDGSVIAAPDGPYKVKPDDPGGKTFAGTGDASFKVGEGQETEGKVAAVPAPKPAPTPSETPETKLSPPVAAPAAPSPTSSTSIPVQVGAYSTKSQAEKGWSLLYGQHEALKGIKYRIVEGQADIGTVYRLQAMAPSVAAANSLCDRLKADGASCQVKR
ncbi:MAG: SPOR domain-containing protein [Novosphingobium sp.]|nr:SPOR domain-containing protein [Novosphingobium sp.]